MAIASSPKPALMLHLAYKVDFVMENNLKHLGTVQIINFNYFKYFGLGNNQK